MKKIIDTFMKLGLSLALIFVITSGCEDDASTDIGDISDPSSLDRVDPDSITRVIIDPASANVSSIGDTIAFQVRGGDAPYTWRVGSAAAGSISPTTSQKAHDSVVYTAAAKLPNTITVTDKLGRIADATINGSSAAMTIAPSTLAIPDTNGRNYDFTVANAVGTVTWTASHPDLGSIAVLTATSARFTTAGSAAIIGPSPLLPNATITITARDSRNVSATATLTMTEP